MHIADTSMMVRDVITSLNEKRLIDADFQREYVWSQANARDFVEAVLPRETFPSGIHFVRVGSQESPWQLLDGKQRVFTCAQERYTAEQLGFTDSQWEVLLNAAVHVHRHCVATEDAAVDLFCKINKGTPLIPYEIYRPRLAVLHFDKEWYGLLQRDGKGALEKVCNYSSAAFAKYHTRKQGAQLSRCLLGMFYKYATGHLSLELYKSKPSSVELAIEEQVRLYLSDLSKDEGRQIRKSFIKQVEEYGVATRDILSAGEKTVHPAVITTACAARWHLYALGYSVDDWARAVKWIAEHIRDRIEVPARFDVEAGNGVVRTVRLQHQSISSWMNTIKELDASLDFSQKKKARNLKSSAVGRNAGHAPGQSYAEKGNSGSVSLQGAVENRSKGKH